jgi:hypothetical protein
MIPTYKRSILIREFHLYFLMCAAHRGKSITGDTILFPCDTSKSCHSHGRCAQEHHRQEIRTSGFHLRKRIKTQHSYWWLQKAPGLHAAATTLPQCSMLGHAIHALNVLRCWRRLLFSRALWVGRPCSCHGCCGCLGIHPRDAKLHLAVGRKPASHQAWRVFLSFFKLETGSFVV